MRMTRSSDASEPGLQRAIGGRMLIVFIIGDILGAGIYALVGRLANFVGGTVWLPLAIGFAVAALTAGSYAELVGKYPRAAGAALYTHKAFARPFLTFIVAFAVMMSGIASASAAALAFGGRYLTQFVDAPQVLAGFGFLAAVTLVNAIGIAESVKLNLVLTIVEVTGLVIVIVVGILGIAQGSGDASRALDFDPGDGSGVLMILGATATGFYALIGFEDSVNLAEECEEPRRTFPRALFTGIAVTGVIYLLVSVIAVVLVPPATLGKSSGPLLEVVTAAGVSFPPQMFALIALLAIGNTALINMIMASRLLYGMANEGIVPRVLGRVHPRRQTPLVAIGFTVAIAAALVSTGDLGDLAATTVLLLLAVFGIVNVSVLVLRRTPVEHDHFRTPTWAAGLGALTTLALATPLGAHKPRVYLLAAILVGIGAVLWLLNWLITGSRVTEVSAAKLVK